MQRMKLRFSHRLLGADLLSWQQLDEQSYISVQYDNFDVSEWHDWLSRAPHDDGAVVTFVGKVRQNNEHTKALELEHFPGMTEKSLLEIIQQARQRWGIGRTAIIHRVGELSLGENIVFVGVSSPHRSEAFSACEFMMDYLKTNAPFWKKAITKDGEHWVEAKRADQQRAERWQKG